MIWSMARQTGARPGRVQRLNSSQSTESEPSSKTPDDQFKTSNENNTEQTKMIQKSLSVDETHHIDDDCLQRFIKVNVRLMTEDRVSYFCDN